ncbi:polysaccharide deacetylase family protein [Streptomyces netropsis]|uniref:polysaccharide deacetylase family protein n=1 Tax=Streptomyces netropsis TaxID=55404 RepID=UPI0030CB072D
MDRISRPPARQGKPRRSASRLVTVLLLIVAGAACSTIDLRTLESEDGQPGGLAANAGGLVTPQQRAVAAAKWGLGRPPLAAPPPPAVKPALETPSGFFRGPGLIPAITRVPTTDNVVFLTIDDGTEKDPQFAAMARELGVPFSAFVTDSAIRDDYGYYRDLHAHGHAIHNHTLTHPQLTQLEPEDQHAQICGQQDILQHEFGTRPALFRPPFGDFDRDTLVIARECGVRVAPLWSEEAFPDRLEYRRGDRKLHPGDIILTHFNGPRQWGGSMTDMLRLVLRKVTEQGMALARLEDYV